MTEPRTVTLDTHDHGQITIPEPAWCAGHEDVPQYRLDVTHVGPDEPLTLPTRHGPVTHLVTALESRPFVDDPFLKGVFVSVAIDGDWYPTGLAGLEAMAAALEAHADELRARARRLAALLDEGESAALPADPVEALLGMARKLVERLETRTAPWGDVTPGSGSHASTVEQTLNGRTLRLQAAIVDTGSEVSQ